MTTEREARAFMFNERGLPDDDLAPPSTRIERWKRTERDVPGSTCLEMRCAACTFHRECDWEADMIGED